MSAACIKCKRNFRNPERKGYVLAVVTNKPTKHVQPVLAAFGIDHLFSEMLGGQSLPVIKPHPGPLYYLCGKFGFEPRQVLFVGDSKMILSQATLQAVQLLV